MKKYLQDFRNRYGVHISTNMSGKMSGIWSLSTSCICNGNCERNAQIPGSICEHCFAAKTIAHYGALAARLEKNFQILTTCRIPAHAWPDIQNDCEIFRLESFGDLWNVTQCENYFNFARRNPKTTFALWTKSPAIVAETMRKCSKPSNLIIITSSLFLNKERDLRTCPAGIDKVFTVYEKEYAAANGIRINCGARSCNTCRRCYNRRTSDHIRELLK